MSEEKYRRIVETANEGVWEIDKDTRTLFVNSLMAEMLGYTAEEMIGRSVFEFLLSEDLSEAKRKLEHAKHGGSARAAEFRYRRKDNSVVWLVATNTPKLDEQGNFLGAFAMMSDVTERKQAEEALRQSEERFSRFMEHLPGLAWIKDVEGRYVYANAAAEKAFNTPQDKLYGKTDQEVFPPEIASQFERNDEQALIEGNGVHVVEMSEQQAGILHHSLVTKFPIPGLDGKTILIGGTAFDITERIQMEDALRQARKQAEETADRMARLQEVTASLAGSTIPAQLAELILEQGTRAAGAVTGILVEVLTNGQELKTIAALGYPEGTVRTQPLPLSESTPMSDCIRTRQAVWIRSQEEFAAQYPPFAEVGRDIGIQAVVALPLIVGDRTLGGLAFSFAEQHEFLLEERGFFLAVAQQCAQGLERARAEEARRESEERYRAIINQATAGIVRKDANGKLLFVNQAFCDMLGYSAQELTDKTMWQLTHEDDVTENQRLFNRLMVEGIPFQLEKRLIRRNGLILWVTVSVSPVLDAAGKPHSAVSVYADITERKQAEEKLAMELADTKQLQTISSQLIREDNINVLYEQILDATMAVMRSDMGSIQMLYPDKNELLLLVSKGLDPASAAFWEWVRSDSGSTCGVALRTGERVIVSDVETCDFIAGTADLDFYRLSKIKAVQSTPLVSRSGRIVGMISNHWLVRHQPSERDLRLLDVLARQAADLIERKQAEEALHQSKERYRNLFDLVPVAVYSCDAQGRIQEYNRSAIELWGREPHRNDPDEKYCGSFKIYYPDGRFMPHKECPTIPCR